MTVVDVGPHGVSTVLSLEDVAVGVSVDVDTVGDGVSVGVTSEDLADDVVTLENSVVVGFPVKGVVSIEGVAVGVSLGSVDGASVGASSDGVVGILVILSVYVTVEDSNDV